MLAIETQNLTKNYGPYKAINQLSFQVLKGEVVGFLGPNGAGKTTTMRILSGLLAATSGKAEVYGWPVARYPHKIKRLIGYMPENNPLVEDLRVLEYLKFRAQLKGIQARHQKTAIDRVLSLCDLERTASKKIIRSLSKGFRQRVGIADALLGDPQLIILDEPTIGLDPHQILGIRQLLDSLRGEMTVLISSHILPEIEHSCDRVIIINQGHVVTQGSIQEIREAFIPCISYELETNVDPKLLGGILATYGQYTVLQALTDGPQAYYRSRLDVIDPHWEPSGSLIPQLLKHTPNALRQIKKLEPSLEDIFIAATQRSWNHKQA